MAQFTKPTLALIAVVALLWLWNKSKRVQRWAAEARARGASLPVQIPLRDPFFGMDYQSALRADLPTNQRLFAKHGRTFGVTPMFGSPHIVTIDPENAICIFGDKNDEWGIEPHRLPPSHKLLGHGFLTCDGDEWARSRKVLRPSFRLDHLKNFSILSGQVDELLAKLPADGTMVDMDPLLHMLFLESSMNFIVGVDLKDAPYERQEFLSAFDDALFGIAIQLILGPLSKIIPLPSYNRGCKIAQEYVNFYINLATNDAEQMRNGEYVRGSILRGLNAHTKNPEFIRNNVLQAFLASQDTTMSLVCTSLFLLSRNPRYWSLIREEAITKGDAFLTTEGISNSVLLRNILYEALRMHPVFPHQIREALRDTTLPTGGGKDGTEPIFVPKGTSVIGELYSVHQNPEVYGSDVATFRPERWETINPSQWEFLGFGGGKRSCLGKPKALTEAGYVLVRLALAFPILESKDDRPYKLEYKIISKNEHGCKVAFRK